MNCNGFNWFNIILLRRKKNRRERHRTSLHFNANVFVLVLVLHGKLWVWWCLVKNSYNTHAFITIQAISTCVLLYQISNIIKFIWIFADFSCRIQSQVIDISIESCGTLIYCCSDDFLDMRLYKSECIRCVFDCVRLCCQPYYFHSFQVIARTFEIQ